MSSLLSSTSFLPQEPHLETQYLVDLLHDIMVNVVVRGDRTG